jgi:hypothetical protein
VPKTQRQSTKLIHGGWEARIPRMIPELRTAHARFERAGDRDCTLGVPGVIREAVLDRHGYWPPVGIPNEPVKGIPVQLVALELPPHERGSTTFKTGRRGPGALICWRCATGSPH